MPHRVPSAPAEAIPVCPRTAVTQPQVAEPGAQQVWGGGGGGAGGHSTGKPAPNAWQLKHRRKHRTTGHGSPKGTLSFAELLQHHLNTVELYACQQIDTLGEWVIRYDVIGGVSKQVGLTG